MAHAGVILSLALPASAASAGEPESLPQPGSPQFCTAIQEFTVDTRLGGTHAAFTDTVAHRKSTPFAKPRTTGRATNRRGRLPIVAGCKIRTAAHRRAISRPDSAGAQLLSPDMTRRIRA
jgi:hypothetical protein